MSSCVPFFSEVVGLEDERAKVAWLERQCLLDRGLGSGIVVETATGVGEPDAGRGIRLAGRDDLFERLAGSACVASTEGFYAGPGERTSVGGWRMHDKTDSVMPPYPTANCAFAPRLPVGPCEHRDQDCALAACDYNFCFAKSNPAVIISSVGAVIGGQACTTGPRIATFL